MKLSKCVPVMASGCEEKFYICPAHAAHVRGVRVVATLCMMVMGGTTGAARQNNREVLCSNAWERTTKVKGCSYIVGRLKSGGGKLPAQMCGQLRPMHGQSCTRMP